LDEDRLLGIWLVREVSFMSVWDGKGRGKKLFVEGDFEVGRFFIFVHVG
jgi:hypothetical protein